MSAPPPIFRVCLTGSECTGKTTLARALAAEFHLAMTPEFSREYAASRNGLLGARDVQPIACGQLAMERAALTRLPPSAPPLLLLDTDILSTVVYARFYYGGCPPWIEFAARDRLAGLYLLCGTGVPWQADGVRDQPAARGEIQSAFRATLAEFGARVIGIEGPLEARLAACRAALRPLLAAA